MADREEKTGDENTKSWISGEQKERFRWNKKHFSQFFKGYHLEKNKNLIENIGHNFKYLSQEFGNNVLDLVKQKGFSHYEYMNDFERIKKKLPSKEKFYRSLNDR